MKCLPQKNKKPKDVQKHAEKYGIAAVSYVSLGFSIASTVELTLLSIYPEMPIVLQLYKLSQSE